MINLLVFAAKFTREDRQPGRRAQDDADVDAHFLRVANGVDFVGKSGDPPEKRFRVGKEFQRGKVEGHRTDQEATPRATRKYSARVSGVSTNYFIL